jgi:hypothetical protein
LPCGPTDAVSIRTRTRLATTLILHTRTLSDMGALDQRLYTSHHAPTDVVSEPDCVKLACHGCMSSSGVRLSLSNCTHQLHPCTVLTAAHHTHTRPPDVLARIASPQLLSNKTPLLSCAVLPVFETAWRTTRHPHPLEQILVVGWIGVSPHRFPPPSLKGYSFGKTHPLYTLGTLFLCPCDLNVRCTRIHSFCTFAITPVLFLFILGERTGSLLGFPFSLSLSDFYILIFSHPSYS